MFRFINKFLLKTQTWPIDFAQGLVLYGRTLSLSSKRRYFMFPHSSSNLRREIMSTVETSSPSKKRALSTSPVKLSPVKRLKENMAPTPTPAVINESAKDEVEVLQEIIVNKADTETMEKVSKSSQGDKAPKLFFAKMSDKAHVPSKGSKLAAGYDLKSAYKYIVPARGSCLVKTDIQIKLPSGYYGRVAPRSGLALKHKLDVGAGVIDEDYRGNVGVILFNFGEADFEVLEGDRVAQLICEKICYPEIVEVKSLDETERGEGGFGSTGVSEEKSA